MAIMMFTYGGLVGPNQVPDPKGILANYCIP